jgi:hypothetical protein
MMGRFGSSDISMASRAHKVPKVIAIVVISSLPLPINRIGCLWALADRLASPPEAIVI